VGGRPCRCRCADRQRTSASITLQVPLGTCLKLCKSRSSLATPPGPAQRLLRRAGPVDSDDDPVANSVGRLLVISPFAKVNMVDSSITDQSSILTMIEDNWHTGRIGDGSFDAIAGSLGNMFDFSKRTAKPIFLDPNTGAPSSRGQVEYS